jgi:hypothetical protein
LAVLLILGAWFPDVQAGCNVNVFVKNLGKVPIQVIN